MATFYVRADGSATKANAIGPTTDATKCMPVATCNTGPFSAGDIIRLSDKGGALTALVTIPSSGANGNNIIYEPAPGETPQLTGGMQFPGTRNYITIRNLTIPLATALASDIGIYVAGATTGSLFQNLTINSAGYGIRCDGNTTGVTIDTISLAARTTYGVFMNTAVHTNPTIQNITTARGGGVWLVGGTGTITISGITTVGQGVTPGVYMTGCSGTATISNLAISGNTYGLQLASSSFTSCTTAGTIAVSNCTNVGTLINGCTNVSIPSATISSCGAGLFVYGACDTINLGADYNTSSWSLPTAITISGCAGDSILIGSGGPVNVWLARVLSDSNGGYGSRVEGTAHNVFFKHCEMKSNLGDGYSIDGNAYDVSYDYCYSHHNGGGNHTDSGDGWTAHNDNHGINIRYCIAAFNGLTGMAMTGTSSGDILNCTMYGNGTDVLKPMTGSGSRAHLWFEMTGANATTGRNWKVRNCIIAEHPAAAGTTASAPRALFLTGQAANKSLTDIDQNLYLFADSDNFCTMDGGSTNASWTTYHTTQTWEPNTIRGNPLLTDPANGDFTLSTYASPAVDAGTDLNLTTDYAGNDVPGDERDEATPDIGAYQMTAAQIAAQQLATDQAAVAANAANIKKGVEVLGTTGTFNPSARGSVGIAL